MSNPDQQREAEIARLEGVRDRMLQRAPTSLWFRQMIVPLMAAMFVWSFGSYLWRHPGNLNFVHVAIGAVFLLLFGSMVWKTWVNPPAPGDLWGAADRLGYEGDSPRDIQRKIDELRRGS